MPRSVATQQKRRKATEWMCLPCPQHFPGCTVYMSDINVFVKRGEREKANPSNGRLARPSSLSTSDNNKIFHLEKGTNDCLSAINETNRTNKSYERLTFRCVRAPLSQSNRQPKEKQWLTRSPLEGNAKHYSAV